MYWAELSPASTASSRVVHRRAGTPTHPRGAPTSPGAPRTTPAHWLYKPRARVCGHCTSRAVSGPLPLLPGVMCGGRAASVFPTSPPQRARGRGREHYGSSPYEQRQQEEGGTGIWGGNPGTPPAPQGPVPRSPQTPLLTSPQTTRPTAPMTGGRCPVRPRIPRRACRTRKPARAPPALPPGPRARSARRTRLTYRADPGTEGNQTARPPTPSPRSGSNRGTCPRGLLARRRHAQAGMSRPVSHPDIAAAHQRQHAQMSGQPSRPRHREGALSTRECPLYE
jgi:hypothetical protein